MHTFHKQQYTSSPTSLPETLEEASEAHLVGIVVVVVVVVITRDFCHAGTCIFHPKFDIIQTIFV